MTKLLRRGDRRRAEPEDVAWAYQALLGREPTDGEIQGELAGAPSVKGLMMTLVTGAEHRARQQAATQAGATKRFVEDLRLLNDTLATTEFRDAYWVWGGLLIGWARDGWPLAHDSVDADFCVRVEDLPLFESGVQALLGAGFEPMFRFRDNAGRATEFTFWRGNAKFEFFVLEPKGERLQYHEYTVVGESGGAEQAVASIPAQPLVSMDFVGRTWRRHADHDAELTEMYGDWRTPDPTWHCMQDQAIDELVPWTGAGDYAWTGELDGIREGWDV